ncbi:MAG: response regulator [Alphaproteobacteria bacterium]|nr:response regulator [Alphaproteobacteria bacterium]
MASKGRILIVDDEKDIRFLLREILEDEGYDVSEAAHSEAAYADIAAKGMPDLVILDIWLENSDRDGMEILGDLKRRSKTLPVLMISGHGNIEMAVKAIKIGAYDFIEKPFNTDRLLHLVSRAFEQGRKRGGAGRKIDFVSVSPDMQAAIKAAQKAAAGEARVLITGAWGTGRAHLAKYIHQESQRAGKACVSIQCAALDAPTLAEALAHEGSVIFRDIHKLSASMQADLLGRLNAKPEARVMATADAALLDGLRREGKFLSDLYERLSVVTLVMPTLQDRRADLADMCASMIGGYFDAWGLGGPVRVNGPAIDALKQMAFEGQALELEALCFAAAVSMAQAGRKEVTPNDFASDAPAAVTGGEGVASGWLQTDLRTAREAFERWYLENIMARFDGNVSQAAAFAGMDRTAFHRKLKALKGGGEDAEAA